MYTMSKIKFIFPLYSILGTLDTKYVTKKKIVEQDIALETFLRASHKVSFIGEYMETTPDSPLIRIENISV